MIGILGQTITPFVALALVPNLEIGWRLLFAIGGLIAISGLVLRVRLPESPRWEILHGHSGKVEKTIQRIEQYCLDRQILLSEPDPAHINLQSGVPFQFLFKPRYARRLAVFILMWFLWYIDNYGFLGDAADLIAAHGASISNSITFLAVGAIGYPLGTLLVLKWVDHFERKKLIFCTTVVWFIGMILIAGYASDLFIYAGSLCASIALGAYLQVAYTFTAEVFPTQARATGFALSDGIGHADGTLGALLLPAIIAHFSFFTGFSFIGCTGLLAEIISLLGPETTGQSLEHVSS